MRCSKQLQQNKLIFKLRSALDVLLLHSDMLTVRLTVSAGTDNAVLPSEQRSVENRLRKDPGYRGRGGKEHNVSRAFLLRRQAASARSRTT